MLIRYRRMFGLFAFFYGCLHFLTYVWLDQFFALDDIVEGRREAAVHHGRLHGLRADDSAGGHVDGGLDSPAGREAVESAAPPGVSVGRSLGVIHYLWLVKADTSRPIRYGVIIGSLLLARLFLAWRGRVAATRASASARLAPMRQ